MIGQVSQCLALLVMGVSVGFLVYTYAGYPLLMARLQKRGWRYGPARTLIAEPGSSPQELSSLPSLTVVIAAYNAAQHIESKLESMLSLDYPADKLSVLVVSDGSVDATNDLVNQFAQRDARVSLLANATRRGKAACLNDAVAASDSALLLMTDARQTFDAGAARWLVRHFADPAVGAVSGALSIDPSATDGVVASAGAYWRMEKKLRAAESEVHSAVGVSGAIYALRREAFEPLPEQTILDDVLIPMIAVMNGWRVLFDREAIAFDRASVSEAQERGRKIRTLAGNFQLVALQPGLLNPSQNPLWWQFYSHKMFRVIAPVAMAAFFLANLVLASSTIFWLLLCLGQVLVYTVSVLPEGQGALWQSKPMRLLTTLRGFVRLQWFAVLGFIWFWRNRQPQLWETTRHSGSSRESSRESS